MMRFVRSAFVIGRRDFGATVLSKTFIFFLIGPLFPLVLGGLFGSIGARVATQTERPAIAVVGNLGEFHRLAIARNQLAQALPEDSAITLVHYAPEHDLEGQQRELLASKDPPIRAVLSGGLASPRLAGSVTDDGATVAQLRMIIANARAPQPPGPVAIGVTRTETSSGSLAKDRAVTAQIGQMLLFFLTILLSGMVMSQLIEEKSNKIIEVIAAAVPIDAMFVGKLFAMLAASIVGLVVWVASGALLIQVMKTGGLQTLPAPAVGWATFLLLSIVYFAMNYLLFGAIFLMIGAQASTSREVQTLSMPATFGQVLVFGFASTVIGSPNSPGAIAAALVPLSSPMAMLARAAEEPLVWPHLLAIAWQALWVAIILRLGAQLFRKTVLKSGPQRPWWKLRRARSPA